MTFSSIRFWAYFGIFCLIGATATLVHGATLSGTEHNYIVTFNDNNQATVAAEIKQTNYTDQPISSLSLIIPGDKVTVSRAVLSYTTQEKERYCERYTSTISLDSCFEYRDRDVTKTHIEILKPTAEKKDNGMKVDIPLTTAIAPTKEATIYLVYKVFGYTKDAGLGQTNFAFETPAYTSPVDSVSVAVYVDDTLFLKGSGRGKTNYSPSVVEGIEKFSDTAAMPTSLSDSFSNAIQEPDTLTKTKTNLNPGDTFTVSGSYASSWLRIYYLPILVSILGVFAFIIIIVIGERSLTRHQNKK